MHGLINNYSTNDHLIKMRFTAELLGFNGYIPPFSNTRGRDILRGVNYASAAAGIRDETGRQLVIFFFLFFLLINSLYSRPL